jgi:hypothetical protein
MFIFNTTFLVNPDRVKEWQQWMVDTYCPAIGGQMVTHGFEVFEVMASNGDDSRTFSVQWRCESSDLIEQIDDISAKVINAMNHHFGESVLHFCTVLQQVKLD